MDEREWLPGCSKWTGGRVAVGSQFSTHMRSCHFVSSELAQPEYDVSIGSSCNGGHTGDKHACDEKRD